MEKKSGNIIITTSIESNENIEIGCIYLYISSYMSIMGVG